MQNQHSDEATPPNRVRTDPATTNTVPAMLIGASEERVSEDEDMLSYRDVLRAVRLRLWLVLLVTVVCTGIALGYSFLRTPMYEASIEILVGQKPGTSENPIGVQDLQQLTQTMTEAVNSRP